jgi:hypothetical protein
MSLDYIPGPGGGFEGGAELSPACEMVYSQYAANLVKEGKAIHSNEAIGRAIARIVLSNLYIDDPRLANILTRRILGSLNNRFRAL